MAHRALTRFYFAKLSELDRGAAKPLNLALSEWLLQPVDRLVALCVKHCETCEVQPVGTGEDASPNVSPSVCRPVANVELEEGKRKQSSSATTEARIRNGLQCAYLLMAAGIIITSYYFQLFAASTDAGTPANLVCRGTLLRYSTAFGGSQCGRWGEECEPTGWMAIRCPALCGLGLNDPIDTRVIGSSPYRADSRMCIAAWHAGYIGWSGGCVDVRISGARSSFEASASHGVDSVAFSSWFPYSLEFRQSAGARHCGYGQMPSLLILNVVSLVGFLWLRPSKRCFFWAMLSFFWWYCALIAPMTNRSVGNCFQYFGRFAYFVFGAEVLLWRLGNAKGTFPDTRAGSVLDAIFIELLPLLVTLHWHFLGYAAGGYSLNGALFQSWEGPLAFILGLMSLAPFVCGVLRDWYRAGLLRWVLMQVLLFATAVVGLTLIFSTSGWGLHLHHYFIGLMGYLGSRGRSRWSAVARALCLGALINGLSHWGETYEIPIWTQGAGWYPHTGQINAGGWGHEEQVIFTAAERVNNSDQILLRWALVRDLSASNCSLSTYQAQDSSIFVVEMNHIEIYRGPARSVVAPLPATDGRVFVRAGRISPGLVQQVVSATQVLGLNRTGELLRWPYGEEDDCSKAAALVRQPEEMLDGFI
ncbi:unnamed protein product [Effrenium voratum]|nr:unnamed protein product [Effrenium voratum]